jgi:dipeptidyl aminopeptidase/acylaminoacyl peptidase
MARTITLGTLMLAVLVAGIGATGGMLLVESNGKLLFIRTDGTQQILDDGIVEAALSRDGQKLAFTQPENPRALPNSPQVLSIMATTADSSTPATKVSIGTPVRSLDWLPGGDGVVYEGKDGHLFVARSPNGFVPRDLGPWYQGFSVSADGSKAVHAVNSPAMGLEVLEIASGQRTLIHKTTKVVWSAKFSPDGDWIAYQITLRDPPRTKDDEPDCTPPTIGLRIYSLRKKTDSAVTIAAAPKDWTNVKSFNWSPDSKRLAVMIGTTDCDYPGDANGVFVTTLDLKSQLRASTSDMSLDPVFSPDGSAVAFVDASEPSAKLMRFEPATGTRTLIRRATPTNNSYHLLDWK